MHVWTWSWDYSRMLELQVGSLLREEKDGGWR
jgi:hypothetical protein